MKRHTVPTGTILDYEHDRRCPHSYPVPIGTDGCLCGSPIDFSLPIEKESKNKVLTIKQTTMPDFKSRLLTEKTELDEKIDKLSTFTKSDSFATIDPRQQSLLGDQLTAMLTYSDILEHRIALLNE